MSQDSILSMLGLAKRAGKVVSGEFSTEKAVKTGSAFGASGCGAACCGCCGAVFVRYFSISTLDNPQPPQKLASAFTGLPHLGQNIKSTSFGIYGLILAQICEKIKIICTINLYYGDSDEQYYGK